MKSDRISYFALYNGTDGSQEDNVFVFMADKIRYRFIEDKFEAELLDGEEISDLNWLKIEFMMKLYYFDQQVFSNEIPTGIANYFTQALAVNKRLTISGILNALRTPSANYGFKIYPKLLDSHGFADYSNYLVRLSDKNIDLINAAKGGRFNPYTEITLRTINPLNTYPDWADIPEGEVLIEE